MLLIAPKLTDILIQQPLSTRCKLTDFVLALSKASPIPTEETKLVLMSSILIEAKLIKVRSFDEIERHGSEILQVFS